MPSGTGRGRTRSGAAPDRPEPTVTVSAAARRLGVAAATLRSWDRRYGLGPTGRAEGAHRRYTEADLARLATMRALTLHGMAPAEAARAALQPDTAEAQAAIAAARPAPPTAPAERHRHRGRDPEAPRGLLGLRLGARAGGTPSAAAASRGLKQAALGLDAAACDDILAASLRRRGAVATWQDVAAPALAALGDQWRLNGEGVDAEHVLSDAVLAAFRAVAVAAGRDQRGRPALLAATPEEAHVLPLHALAAALGERGVPTRTVGAGLPWPALAAAVRRLGPSAVFLWSQRPATADPDGLASLPVTRPPARIVLCGPGWRGRTPPAAPDTALAEDLSAAVAYGLWAAGA